MLSPCTFAHKPPALNPSSTTLSPLKISHIHYCQTSIHTAAEASETSGTLIDPLIIPYLYHHLKFPENWGQDRYLLP